MVKYKNFVFVALISFFLLFSFSPTIFELSQSNNLADKSREFILEHNYYWPDYNLYLSKIRQGFEGHLTAKELYTSEPHRGSLIQEFYVVLGLLGRFLKINPNFSYLLGRTVLSPLLLIIILFWARRYFNSFRWQLIAYLVVITSGSFPRFWFDQNGALQIGRYMEWWSNIDSLQRITFIPHILFGQVVSFYLLYQITINKEQITRSKLILFIILGNLTGIVFPPSLITLDGVLVLTVLIKITRKVTGLLGYWVTGLFIIFTLPSLFYLLFLTKQLPWSALVDFHRSHPMMIPLDQYVLGTGPIIFLGFLGAIISIIKKEKKYQPLILWLVVTFGLASFFSIVKEQSPLRFTQTGVFIPLGILGTYFFQQIYPSILKTGGSREGSRVKLQKHDIEGLDNLVQFEDSTRETRETGPAYNFIIFLIVFFILKNLFMMKVSFDWQVNWIRQLIAATYPAVPYPPQTVFPLKDWMAGIRWLADNTKSDDVVLSEITAGNYIPAYSGNTVYLGQANTVDFENKKILVDEFFKGEFNLNQAEIFIKNGRIKYVFESDQEKDQAVHKNLPDVYPFLKPVFHNSIVTIYKVKS